MTSACSGSWALYVSADFKESEPVQVDAKLHNDPDPAAFCAQVLSPVSLRFNLDTLKGRYQSQYQTETGTIRVNLEGGAEVDYHF